MIGALDTALKSVTKDWKTAKRKADREDRVRRRDLERMRGRSHEVTIQRAAYWCMEQAYMAASANGRLPANARQIMYSARPLVMKYTGGRCWSNSSYFTQHLLPDYMDAYPEETADWSVVFDARGHLWEPHTGRRADLGTLEVRSYVESWGEDEESDAPVKLECRYPTCGPENRYRFALFVEKEGFTPLLRAARIAERYDLAVMSTKGMSVTAARELIEKLSARGVTILAIRDFDKAGFSIVHTLRTSGRRYYYRKAPRVVDLGLRLADVEEMRLESEPVDYGKQRDPRWNLRESGATEEECGFLVSDHQWGTWIGQRVELNAMTSDQFVTWLERKLKAKGVERVIPDDATLAQAFKRSRRLAFLQHIIDEIVEAYQSDDLTIPPDLRQQIADLLAEYPEWSWDAALWAVVSGTAAQLEEMSADARKWFVEQMGEANGGA
jgi:hypothetical protein